MTAVMLPDTPSLQLAEPRMIDWGGTLTPPGGGPVQRYGKLGTRFSLALTMPIMDSEPHGRIWAARLRRALLDGAIAPFIQDGLNVGAPGAPVVDGAGQSGSTINLRGFTPWYIVREGQFFSIIHNGRRYLHSASATIAAGATGLLALPIHPMLRIMPGDGAVCEFARPMIEGLIEGPSTSWKVLTEPLTELAVITISETA